MKIGVVINTNDPETAWNAMRFALTGLIEDHDVKVFLMGKGVEIESITNPKFNAMKVVNEFLENGGEIMACGACLEARKTKSKICSVNIMSDLVKMVEECDKVITFG
jgi:uncharacterized protein involved in oxidation of intracellular sulfur